MIQISFLMPQKSKKKCHFQLKTFIFDFINQCSAPQNIAMNIMESMCWMIHELGSKPYSDPNFLTK